MLNLSQVYYSQIHDVHNVHTYTCDVHTHIIMCKVFNTLIFVQNIPFLILVYVYTCMYMCTNTLCICVYILHCEKYVYTYMYMCKNTFMYMYLHTMYIMSNIHMIHFTRMCICIYTYMFPQCAWTYGHFVLLYMYMHTCILCTCILYFWNGLHCKMCVSSILSHIVFSF